MIRRLLDVFSGHLSPETRAWLDAELADDMLREPRNPTAAAIAGGRTRYGWFIYAFTDSCIDLPDDLKTICKLARRQRAEYILFDCDAEPSPELPVLHPDLVEPR